jgi:hypothetical protein
MAGAGVTGAGVTANRVLRVRLTCAAGGIAIAGPACWRCLPAIILSARLIVRGACSILSSDHGFADLAHGGIEQASGLAGQSAAVLQLQVIGSASHEQFTMDTFGRCGPEVLSPEACQFLAGEVAESGDLADHVIIGCHGQAPGAGEAGPVIAGPD